MQNYLKIRQFNKIELKIAKNAFKIIEELVSEYYKISSNEWKNSKYSIATMSKLIPEEIIIGPYAQIIKYEYRIKNGFLKSTFFNFYKICIQDHNIINIIKKKSNIKLFYFLLYITTHELVHVLRFIRFFQNFKASPVETFKEEKKVHLETYNILYNNIKNSKIKPVFKFYKKWLTQ